MTKNPRNFITLKDRWGEIGVRVDARTPSSAIIMVQGSDTIAITIREIGDVIAALEEVRASIPLQQNQLDSIINPPKEQTPNANRRK